MLKIGYLWIVVQYLLYAVLFLLYYFFWTDTRISGSILNLTIINRKGTNSTIKCLPAIVLPVENPP